MSAKCAAQLSLRMPNGLSEANKGNNVSHRGAQQHPRETKSGINVSQECRMHSWETKEAESVTERETGYFHGIDIVNGEARFKSAIRISGLQHRE